MRIPRLFVDSPLAPGREVDLDERAHRHAINVLRLRTGSAVVVFDGAGGEFVGELVQIERHRSRVRLGEHRTTHTDSGLEVELVQAVAKGEHMDYSLQKATELGVSAIQPVFTAHGVAAPSASRLDNRLRHWRGVIISACEQSGRSRLPTCRAPIRLETWLSAAETRRAGFVLDPAAPAGLASQPNEPPGCPLYVLVGPEGGLSSAELAAAERSGLTRLRLGPRVLRTETAAAAILVAMQLRWGDLRN